MGSIALQCAQLAAGVGANPAPITAALVHDIGHLEHFLRYMVASLRVVV
jgi:predicted HD phosphohydrolase